MKGTLQKSCCSHLYKVKTQRDKEKRKRKYQHYLLVWTWDWLTMTLSDSCLALVGQGNLMLNRLDLNNH